MQNPQDSQPLTQPSVGSSFPQPETFPPASPAGIEDPRFSSPQPSPSEPFTPSTPPPPPPPPAQTPLSESPNLQQPHKGEGIKKALFIFAGLLALAAASFLIVKLLLPRLQNLQLPGLPGKETTLEYWGLWEPSSVMAEVIKEFEAANPGLKISYTQQNHKEYRERLQSALARGDGPDIFRYHNTWVPMFRDDLDSVPASVFSASEFQETFYPVAVKDLRKGANYVGIPLEFDGLSMFYNKKIFTNAGKTPPTTWDELRKTAFELTVRDQQGRIQTAGVALGTTGNVDHWSDILALMMLQNGADLKNPTDKLASDALLFYTLFYRSDKVWDEILPSSTQAFAAEKVAMIFAPSWRILDIRELNKNLDFGVLPVPSLPNSSVTWASYWAEGVSAKSGHKTEAWKFLKFLSTKETLEKLYKAAADQRGIGEPYGRKDLSDLLKADPSVGAYLVQAPKAQSWYLSSATHDNGINDKIIKYYEDAVNSVNAGAEPGKTLTTVAQGVSQILSQYKAN